MNADHKFNFQSGEVLARLDRVITDMSFGVPRCHEIMFVPSNAHAGAHQGEAE
jgi:hypothetical protein